MPTSTRLSKRRSPASELYQALTDGSALQAAAMACTSRIVMSASFDHASILTSSVTVVGTTWACAIAMRCAIARRMPLSASAGPASVRLRAARSTSARVMISFGPLPCTRLRSTSLENTSRPVFNARQLTEAANRSWPYDAQLIASVIKRNLAAAAEAGQQIVPTTITILDTGLDASFPPSLLRRDDSVDPKYSYGIGVFQQDNIRPYPNHTPDEVRLHGTEVAKIAAGISALQSASDDLLPGIPSS